MITKRFKSLTREQLRGWLGHNNDDYEETQDGLVVTTASGHKELWQGKDD